LAIQHPQGEHQLPVSCPVFELPAARLLRAIQSKGKQVNTLIPYVAPAAQFVDSADGQVITTSLKIAEFFGKQHKDVLRAIERLECSGEFGRRNFAQSSYTNAQNKTQPMITLTRDGFMFLAMGFTGPKAAQIKEAYIAAFNQMERELRGRESEQAMKLQRELITAQTRAARAERGWRIALQRQLKAAKHSIFKPIDTASNQLPLAGV
jgi:anti-repressor protein